MRQLVEIIRKDLRLRLRDRSLLLYGVVAPLSLALVLGGIFGTVDDDLEVRAGLVDADGGQVATGLVELLDQLEEEGVLADLRRYDRVADARSAITDGEIEVAVVVPEGFSDRVTSGSQARLQVLGDADASLSTGVVAAIADQYGDQIEVTSTAITAAAMSGAAPETFSTIAEQTGGGPPLATLGVVETEVRQLDQTTYLAAGMTAFFLLFTAGIGVSSLLAERTERTADRILVAGVGPGGLVLAKAVLSALVGIGSTALLVVATQLLLGASWGDPLGVAVLVVTAVLAATGVMMLVASLARTAEQSQNVQGVVAVVLGALGGSFFPITGAGPVLSAVSAITPHRWFLSGLARVHGTGTVSDALPEVAALLAIALGTGVIGAVLLRGELRT